MPISFLEQNQQSIDVKLKARQLIREFASHRYGIFKESGFRYDPMYPPFSSLAGLANANYNQSFSSSFSRQQHEHRLKARAAYMTATDSTGLVANQSNNSAELNIRGFDENWQECSFETNPASGLPTQSSMNCVPYLCKANTDNITNNNLSQSSGNFQAPPSLNLMSTDPFSYGTGSNAKQQQQPVEWRDLADSTKWHFCGDNFAPSSELLSSFGNTGGRLSSAASDLQQQQKANHIKSFPHNQLTTNKQNIMCHERSAMEVIKSSEEFRRNTFR